MTLTETSLAKFTSFVEKWKNLNGNEQKVASDCDKISNNFELCDLFLGFHKKCYSCFTNKTMIERAQKRMFGEASRSEKVRKLTRSSIGGANKYAAHKRNKYVLLSECIFCHGNQYIVDPVTRMRCKEVISKCEHTSGK